MENPLLDALVEVVGDGSDKHALCEVGDFRSRDKAIELRRDGSRLVIPIDGHRLSLLEDFSEAFGEGLGCFTYDLTAKDVSHGILDNLTFLVAVITRELREILKAQTNCHFVRACRSNEVIQATEVDGRKLVYDDGRFELLFLVDEFHDARIVESECCRINVLAVRIIAYDEDFRLTWVVDVEREIISCHHPIESRAYHARERYLCRSNLPL